MEGGDSALGNSPVQGGQCALRKGKRRYEDYVYDRRPDPLKSWLHCPRGELVVVQRAYAQETAGRGDVD